ncbi:peptidylprolyl isomerase [Oricola cellulosilytica]|uniref:Peptidylprolyl isomerase n=1 Tax=Oricola cellulosilytica TaxID=1429082 RepID=A0A4R0PAQ0_9HYPH|nr:peptidylprolyl isomerase [Oricola cellulosilytica]TCD14311.1 peptidylprolyl isomerase [Oricola cellulosilytica]
MNQRNRLRATLLAFVLTAGTGLAALQQEARATEIKVVVNDQAVTSYDIARRSAFLKLQRRSGNVRQIATDELIEEALKRSAVEQAGYRIPDSQVDAAYANFASTNKLSISQLTQILHQAGVTPRHFKEFIRLQIGWSQVVGAQSRGSGNLMSEQEVVAKMLEQGGNKPTSTEYTLQQVIFVVPQSRKGDLKRRRTEANNMRGRVNGCDGTIDLAKQLRDVTVRDLGRVLELRLPERWKKDIAGLRSGQTTRVQDTENGVEFIIVCEARSVSDDRVAQLEFSTKDLEESGGDRGAKLLEELRKNARIERR